MMSFLSTLGWGFAALLTIAVAVALWEYLQSKSRHGRPIPPQEPHRTISLDVNLNLVPEEPSRRNSPQGDQAQRAAALDGALGRMSTPPGTAQRNIGQAWTETQPMVAASLQVELPADRAPNRAPDRANAQPAATPHA